MRDAFWASLLVLLIADAILTRLEPEWIETWDFWYGIGYVITSILVAAWFLAHREWEHAGVWTFFAACGFVSWWNRTKRRRKKLADKAAGLVVDVGGRLKVVREPISDH